tara:strand:- start:830 stop:1204 length:375 start_codon:yes stop_codon:yes gene_type:complete
MSNDYDRSKEGLWISPEFLADQITELKEVQSLLKFSIKEHCQEEKSWDDKGILILMFEYYSCVVNQLKIYYDMLLAKPVLNKEQGKKEYLVNQNDISMLISLANLARVNDYSLQRDYHMSFTIH